MTVLIVDDEPMVAELFQAAFESRGHACLLASSVEEARFTLSMAPIDAITLDLSLPGGGAIAWLESLSGSRPDLAARTTIVSGRSLSVSEAAGAAACGARVLMKPVGIATLVTTVTGSVSGGAVSERGTVRPGWIDSSTRN